MSARIMFSSLLGSSQSQIDNTSFAYVLVGSFYWLSQTVGHFPTLPVFPALYGTHDSGTVLLSMRIPHPVFQTTQSSQDETTCCASQFSMNCAEQSTRVGSKPFKQRKSPNMFVDASQNISHTPVSDTKSTHSGRYPVPMIWKRIWKRVYTCLVVGGVKCLFASFLKYALQACFRTLQPSM
ncbi:Hypothetical_protein [Hexamita inflata]|uniref:Hypothetical_protein n=1 Tax=Hexamita inflata TaxID=28002 RepID=A0AA86QVJ9_9EUKA|nr:Hypothetical protein HINF_LOCUS54486 [Hexamita inflata]